jgi:hypothetical protein
MFSPICQQICWPSGVTNTPAECAFGSDDSFFHFGGGMAIRNLCQERLSDDALAACCRFGGDCDNCNIGVLAAIAAMRQSSMAFELLRRCPETIGSPGKIYLDR